MPYGGTTSNNDTLKFLVGDLSTASSGELISTGKCAQLISMFGGVRAAAPHAARAIAARYADEADKSVGDLSIAASQKSKAYFELARELKSSVLLAGIPFAGGISRSQKTSVMQNSDRVEPSFTIGMHDVLSASSTRRTT